MTYDIFSEEINAMILGPLGGVCGGSSYVTVQTIEIIK